MVGKHGLACALSVQRTAVKQGSSGSIRIGSREKIQLFFGAVVLAGKQQEFEQERAALGVERIGPQLVAKRLDGFPQLPFAVKR